MIVFKFQNKYEKCRFHEQMLKTTGVTLALAYYYTQVISLESRNFSLSNGIIKIEPPLASLFSLQIDVYLEDRSTYFSH